MADDNVVETKLRTDDEVKFTPAEMEKLAELQTSYQVATSKIGQLNVQRILLEQQTENLDNEIQLAKDSYVKIQVEERELVKKLNDYKITTDGNFMIGFPDETPDELENTFNMARVGIAAYGVQITAFENEKKLKPTLEIKTRISNLQTRKKDEAVSYGKAQTLSRDSIIATAPIGYGDGYPWNSFPDGKVIVNNQFCNLIGRVTMDQILFDVTDVNVQIDDEVTVLGNSMDGKLNISVSDIAKWNKTIEWEILTNMSKRLERVEVE